MKKIIITGAFGFIGSHMCEMFCKKGYKVLAFDQYNIHGHAGWLENSSFKKNMEIVFGDVRDLESTLSSFKGYKNIIHLAALVGIPYSYEAPLSYIKTNIEGTYNVLESTKKLNFDQVILTSTSEVYGTAQYVPIDENHPCVGQSPYAASKISADQLGTSYMKSFGLPVKTIRPFNTYGPRQSLRAIIPAIISQCLYNDKIKIGNIAPTRDFTYVEDTCSAFFEVYKSSKLFGKTVNVGSNNEISIKLLIKKIINKVNKNIKVVNENLRKRPAKSEVYRLFCDNTKLLKNTRWKPKFTLDQGIEKTIDWIKNNKEVYKSNIYKL